MIKVKNSRLKKIVLFIGIFFCTLLGLIGVLFSFQNAEIIYSEGNVTFLTDTIKASYEKTETFKVPQAKVVWKGEEYDSTRFSVEFPDGRCYSQDTYVLSQTGEYCVNYYAVCKGENVCAKVKFQVSDELFSVSGNSSSAYYGTSPKVEGMQGIVVRLTPGNKFTFNKPIDLSDNLKVDNLLRFYSLPKAVGVSDVWAVRVRLTDVADANNYVDVFSTVNLYNRNEEENPYASKNVVTGAGANGQPLTGMHLKWVPYPGYPLLDYDGQKYCIYDGVNLNSDIGYPSLGFSFSAREGYGKLPYELSMDYAERQLFGSRCAFAMAGNGISSNGMIIDLDEPLFFKTLWGGFTTGKAILSISAEAYVNSDFEFIITNIDGEDLSVGNYFDEMAPEIQVELPVNEKGVIPIAVANVPYKLFYAVAVDDTDGYIPCKAYVYKGYESNIPMQLNVKNGTFTPKSAGIYDVVYVAYDKAGNRAEKLVKVYAKSENELMMALSPLGSETFISGNKICLPQATVTGAEGEYSLQVGAVLQNGGVDYTVEQDNGEYSFRPLHAGLYEIVYRCSDYNGEIEERLSIEVQASENAYFPTDAALPEYFIKNGEYAFPDLKGVDLSNGMPVEKNAKIAYAFDNGDFVEYTGGKVVILANERVDVRYTIANTSKTETIKVADVNYGGKLSVKDYFQGEGFTSISDQNAGYYTTEQDGKLSFVRPLLTNNFSLQFKITAMNFKELRLIMTDAENNFCELCICVQKQSDGYRLIKVGEQKWTLDTKTLVGELLVLQYKDGDSEIYFGGTRFPVGSFAGFKSGSAYLSLEFVDVSSSSSISILNVNGQKISSQTSDYAAPTYAYKINNGAKTVGDEIVISYFRVMDVLQLNGEASLTVKAPDGSVCYSTDSVKMSSVKDFSREYRIAVTVRGIYKITGTISDGKMGEEDFTLNIVCEDGNAPVITLNGKTNYGTLNKQVKLATAEAVDDLDGNIGVSVYIVSPTGKTDRVISDSFVPNICGLYTVLYYATDAAGNLAFERYEILIGE